MSVRQVPSELRTLGAVPWCPCRAWAVAARWQRLSGPLILRDPIILKDIT